jgi:hypothetical protein
MENVFSIFVDETRTALDANKWTKTELSNSPMK